MRVAVVADIHGTLVALDAVLADLARQPVDLVVCLGDVAATGPQPRETIERLRALGWPTVLGNADREMLERRAGAPTRDDGRPIWDLERWCAEQLTPADLEYLRTFRPIIDILLGDAATLRCYHGSSRSDTDIIAAATPDEATIMAGGHTHVQLLRPYRSTLLLNPGSVGLPVDLLPGTDQIYNPPRADYAAVTYADGALGVELRRIPLDATWLRQTALDSGMPHAAQWRGDWSAWR